MRAAGFILFAVVMAAVAALSTLVASRYLGLEKEVAELHSQIDGLRLERNRQEEEKTALRLERERVQADLEARYSQARSQLEECGNERQNQLQEITASLLNLQKRLTDIQSLAAPSAVMDKAAPTDQTPNNAGQPVSNTPAPNAIDVPRGAIPTPAQEARKLQNAGGPGK